MSMERMVYKMNFNRDAGMAAVAVLKENLLGGLDRPTAFAAYKAALNRALTVTPNDGIVTVHVE
jgi:hypothetical protein